METGEATLLWLRSVFWTLPNECRPPDFDDDSLANFANLFGSYLVASYDLAPGTRRMPSPWGCACPICARIVAAPHLRPKKLRTADKRRARRLMEQTVCDLAGLDAEAAIDTLARDEAVASAAAMVAWARCLIERMEGHFVGPEALALWRRFAWEASGAPKKGFEVSLERVLEAQHGLKGLAAPQRVPGRAHGGSRGGGLPGEGRSD